MNLGCREDQLESRAGTKRARAYLYLRDNNDGQGLKERDVSLLQRGEREPLTVMKNVAKTRYWRSATELPTFKLRQDVQHEYRSAASLVQHLQGERNEESDRHVIEDCERPEVSS